MPDVLIIDGDTRFAEDLSARLAARGMPADHCQTMSKAMARLHTGSYKAVLLGNNLPDGKHLAFLPEIRDIPSRPEVLVISDDINPDAAESAILKGAWNYLTKPLSLQRVLALLQRVMDYHAQCTATGAPISLRRCGIVGNSRALLACLDDVARAAAAESNILLIGETGTGKELFARAIHLNSRRATRPFVVVDCAALPDTLVESILFGHEKGAFTNAENRTVGLVRQADGGTLFLDEVGELAPSIQKVFLRVLEGRSFRPVGGAQEITSNFRLVAATNRDLETMSKAGAFRQDLFFRLRGMHITLPPLRTIPEDMSDLTSHFVAQHAKRHKLPIKGISPDFLEALMLYDWPGNIRELMNTVEQALTMAGTEPILIPRHLPRTLRAQVARRSLEKGQTAPDGCSPLAADPASFPSHGTYRDQQIAEMETRYLTSLMDVSQGNIKAACALSGLSRARLYALMKTYGVPRHRKAR
ncbi:two-component system NtrC family response regulator [Desulfobaculum xiamenense]|uniref:Two-component system NtrC family response regulator n=1 Tax=Desulfobaculum xiamenense TaxID=995050 RepID=A0A846QPF7_9BACT|nr:sigma-54 dependent transcriptional regulator [Desulfobaculum xiamenense]NJB67295.1 two-component system NtrC family response regulator [Desulfobaculum xiamenense]